jgi:hypothetical protein
MNKNGLAIGLTLSLLLLPKVQAIILCVEDFSFFGRFASGIGI